MNLLTKFLEFFKLLTKTDPVLSQVADLTNTLKALSYELESGFCKH